jgi:hypothetical protein
MQYFVKNDMVHTYPVPSSCEIKYTGEKLYPTKPKGYEKCKGCNKCNKHIKNKNIRR